MDVPSPKGAALAGDEYQHAHTLVHAMELLKEDRGIVGIGIEVSAAGNVDDLVIRRATGPASYHQVKFVMSQNELLTYTWFIKTSAGGGASILKRFHDSFTALTGASGARPEMALITNRARDGNDPLLGHADGRDDKLMPRLANAGDRSNAGKALAEWAEHLQITRPELDEMLRHLTIRGDLHSLTTIMEMCRLSLESCGLRGGPEAVAACIGAVRTLVIAGQGRHSDIDKQQWQQIIDGLNLAAGTPSATLVVQVIDPHPAAPTATASVDWIDLFQPGARLLKDPAGWTDRLWPELVEAAAALRASALRPVALMGSARLSTGFAIGSLLPGRAGLALEHDAWGQTWSTFGDLAGVTLDQVEHDIGQGDQLAIGLSTTGDLTTEVLAYIRSHHLPIRTFINILPAGGPGPKALPEPSQARGWADATMRAIRTTARDYQPPVHLFQYGPLFGAMLLGSVWNRMPTTQLYDDAAPEYTPTYLIAAT
jgi:SMODS-associated and fused to various effectors sensor domain